MSRKETITKRQAVEKELLLGQFKKTPIVQAACEKVGVGRTTYYRWRRQSKTFARKADEALLEGTLLMNDMAESQLLTLVHERNIGAIRFYLTHNHPKYGNKLEIKGNITHEHKELTSEQKKLVRKALQLAGLNKQKHDQEIKRRKKNN